MTGSQTQWSELETNGFVVVRSFLTAPEMTILREDFARGAPPSSYPHGFKLIGRQALSSLWTKIRPVADEIRANTSLKIDLLTFLTFSHYIVTERTERTSYWHQDFDFDYKLTRDHINYLNFYMPFTKPDAAKSNVCVIPYDALRTKSADAFERLRGSGGHRFVTEKGKTLVFGNYGSVVEGETDPEAVLDFDIEELRVTPSLSEGDLLLMRGDIVHRTQDADTKRTSASVRVTYSKKLISRERLGTARLNAADPASKLESALHECFDALGKSEITIEDFVNFAGGARPKETRS